MIRTVFIVLLFFHALIHLFGFFKAFDFYSFEELRAPTTRPMGIFWLVVALLLLTSLALYIFRYDNWWMLGAVAMILSQVLIIYYWRDAKYGTVLNVILLIAVLLSWAQWNFMNMVVGERKEMRSSIVSSDRPPITTAEIQYLPHIIKKWLAHSGALAKPTPSQVFLKQKALMKMNEDQKDWTMATADQLFTIDPPAFNWAVKLMMNGILPVTGRDKFEDGKGTMTIQLLSLFNVANVSDNPKTNQASLQRYLAEIVWFPHAALSPYISWEEIDGTSAQATLTYNGTTGTGIFHFDKTGRFLRFETLRYKEVTDEKPTPWVVTSDKEGTFSGIKVPVEASAFWGKGSQAWNWLQVEIVEVIYN